MGDRQVWRSVAYAGALALAFTVAVATIPSLRFAYVGSTAKVAMETSQAVIAATVAVLVHGRVRRQGARADLLLVVALGVSVAGNLFTVAVRAADESRDTFSTFATWSSLTITLVAASFYVAAAHGEDRPLPRPWRSARRALAIALLTSAAVWAGVGLLAGRLPDTVTGDFDVATSSRPSLDAGTTVLVVHAIALVLFLAAAAGFTRRAARHDGDPLLVAVATGLVLAGAARLNFMLYPSAHTAVVHTGDVLRLGFYLMLLAGAFREISAYWRDRAQLAVLDERQRIARDLHDGLLQELTFIRAQVSSFQRLEPTPETIGFVADAAERALAESRQAVEALSDEGTDTLDQIVRRTVGEVADRVGLATRFDLAPGVHLEAGVAEQVRRIVREAATNVVRHSGATILTVQLRRRGERVRVALTDDGRGFDADAPTVGFGVRSMRERAAAVGGSIAIEAGSADGARVVLDVPVEPRGQVDPQVHGDGLDQRGGVA